MSTQSDTGVVTHAKRFEDFGRNFCINPEMICVLTQISTKFVRRYSIHDKSSLI